MPATWKDKRKKTGNHVKSVYYRKSDDMWCVEFVLDGKRQYEYRKSEHAAQKRGNYWREQFGEEQVTLPSKPPRGQTSVARYWEGNLRKIAEKILADPENEELHDAGDKMAKLATAAVRIVDHIPPGDDEASDGETSKRPADLSTYTTEDLERMGDETDKADGEG